MPLLNETTNDQAKEAAQILRAGPRNTFNYLFSAWKAQFELLWQGDTQAILDELGTDAVELFTLSGKLVAFLESLKPGCTQEILAGRREITVREDGTVEIVESEEGEEEPSE